MTKQDEWAWRLPGAENAVGIFASREEAIGDALESVDPGTEIAVGRVLYFDPADWLPDCDALLEGMERDASDNDWGFWDDELVIAKPGAAAALQAALSAWCEEYLTGAKVWCVGELGEETVTVPAAEKER